MKYTEGSIWIETHHVNISVVKVTSIKTKPKTNKQKLKNNRHYFRQG